MSHVQRLSTIVVTFQHKSLLLCKFLWNLARFITISLCQLWLPEHLDTWPLQRKSINDGGTERKYQLCCNITFCLMWGPHVYLLLSMQTCWTYYAVRDVIKKKLTRITNSLGRLFCPVYLQNYAPSLCSLVKFQSVSSVSFLSAGEISR